MSPSKSVTRSRECRGRDAVDAIAIANGQAEGTLRYLLGCCVYKDNTNAAGPTLPETTSQRLGVERCSTTWVRPRAVDVHTESAEQHVGLFPANVNLMRVNGEDPAAACSLQQFTQRFQVLVAIPRSLSLRPAFGGVFQKLPAERPLIRCPRSSF